MPARGGASMNYLVTWSNGEEVEYLFLPKDVKLDEFLEEDKNYIVTRLDVKEA